MVSKMVIHPMEGIPQLYFDQLNIIAQHLHNNKHRDGITTSHHTVTLLTIYQLTPLSNLSDASPSEDQPHMFTHKQLLQQPDWPEQKKSEYKQLNQYRDQQMFWNSNPCLKVLIYFPLSGCIFVR